MSYLHCIITRFSYRFKKDSPIEPLLSEKRLDERIRLFKQYCFPSIINQSNPKFYWIIIVDPALPMKYREQLENLINEYKDSELYSKKGPRDIWLHTWDWDHNVLGQIDWILQYFVADWNHKQELLEDPSEWKNPKYLITTRLDDDDSLVYNFTNIIKSHLTRVPKINDFRYLSFCNGYHFYSTKKTLRLTKVPMIALGLTLITVIDKYPLCVYLGSHTRIPMFIKKPEINKIMEHYVRKNKDYPITRKKILDRLNVVRGGSPIYVRNVHDFNLQKNISRHHNRSQDFNKIKGIMKDKFNVDIV